jgi:hypothetical protein
MTTKRRVFDQLERFIPGKQQTDEALKQPLFFVRAGAEQAQQKAAFVQ